jgi:hypothetical protein
MPARFSRLPINPLFEGKDLWYPYAKMQTKNHGKRAALFGRTGIVRISPVCLRMAEFKLDASILKLQILLGF